MISQEKEDHFTGGKNNRIPYRNKVQISKTPGTAYAKQDGEISSIF